MTDSHRADDVAQETMLTALQHAPRARNLRGWLTAVVKNAVRSADRRDDRRTRWERAAARAESLPSASELAERLSIHRDLVEELQRIQEPFREALLLRFFEGCSLAAIAERCGVPVATVNSRLRRGLQQLRARLDRRHGDRESWASAWAVALRSRRAGSTSAIAWWTAAAVVTIGSLLWFHRSADPVEAEPSPGSRRVAASTEGHDGTGALAGRMRLDDPASATPRVTGSVIDVSGAAVPGVTVGFVPAGPEDHFPRTTLAAAGSIMSPGDRRERAVASSETDGDGRFAFARAGNGRIVVLDDAWTTVLAATSWPELRTEHVVIVGPTRRLDGIIRNETGAGHRDARVSFELPPGFRGRFDLPLDHSVGIARGTTTGKNGRFELSRIPEVPGAEVEVLGSGHEPLRAKVPAPGEVLELQLTPLAGPNRIDGVVVDPAGAPVPAATVALGWHRRAVTDPTGRFRLGGVDRSDAHRLVAFVVGFEPVVLEADLWSREADVVLQVTTPASSLGGQVVDAAGEPIAGAWVWIANPSLVGVEDRRLVLVEAMIAGAGAGWNVVMTDRLGRFELNGLLDREYVLRARVVGSCRFGSVSRARPGAEITLRYPDDEATSRVAGVVRDPAGRPRAGVTVAASRAALSVRVPSGAEHAWYANGPADTTDPAGRFVLAAVPTAADLSIGGGGVCPRRLTAGSWAIGQQLELEVDLECHLQIDATDHADGDLVFAVFDRHDRALTIRIPLGQAERPVERCPIDEGRSPTVIVPARARWAALYRGDEEVSRRRLELLPGTRTRVKL